MDINAAARIVLHDWNEGKIQYYTMPPTRNEGEEGMEAKIVSELSKEFNVDEVYGTESSYIGSLKSVIEFNPVEIPPSDPLAFDESMLEDEKESEVTTEKENALEAMAEDAEESEVKKTGSQQNKKVKKAEKKKRKEKAKKSAAVDEDESMDGDYDFKVDYVKKGSSAMDVGEEDDDEDEDEDDVSVKDNGNDKSALPETK